MEGIPTELTRRYLIEHADYALVSSHQQWRTWIWRHHVLLDLTGRAILRLLGIEDRIHLFASHEQALEWVRKCLPANSRSLRPEREGCS